MNALVDPEIIAALYRASQAGVTVDLIVRGICCLVPGLKGISDNIRVVSIIGRFLEHSRLSYFANAGTPEYYIGSADWMPRNFDRRVEVMTPIEDPGLHKGLEAVLATCLEDNRQAWELGPDGQYRRERPAQGEVVRATQRILMKEPWGTEAGRPPKRKRKGTTT
jgi:polyphosphate kinase